MRTSAEQVPSLHRVAPRYLKLITSCNFRPFMLISALMSFVLLVMILRFSMLTSSPYAVELSTSLVKSRGRLNFWVCRTPPRGHIVRKIGYHPVKKLDLHVHHLPVLLPFLFFLSDSV